MPSKTATADPEVAAIAKVVLENYRDGTTYPPTIAYRAAEAIHKAGYIKVDPEYAIIPMTEYVRLVASQSGHQEYYSEEMGDES